MKFGQVLSRSIVVAAAAAFCNPATAGEAEAGGDPASQILAMTGARTKIVWAHQVAGAAKRWGSSSPDFELMGFDTADGVKRVILPGPASYGNPSITPDGTRVVFSDVPGGMIYVVDWDGKNKKPFAKGFALCTWVDPNTGTQWVYAGEAEFHSPIHRYQLDNPEVKELVWSKVCSCSNGWQVSADGTRMGSEFPHPAAGVGILPDGPWYHYGQGCEGCIAPDNSYRFFHMGESAGHSGVMMYDAGGINKRMVPFNNFPGKPRQDSWNPRWSTDVRFLTVSSPNSGPKQEVYLGEFDEGFTRVVRWIQISNRPGQDLCSHAWIDPGLGFRAGEAPLTVRFAAPPGGAQWEWDYGDGTKETAPAARHTYRKAGRYTVTARLGGTLVKGSVQAYPAKPPSVTRVVFYDETHLALSFDEKVQLKHAKLSLESGTPVKGWELTPDGTRLRFELGGSVGKNDSLRLEGIYDTAQVPNPLAEKTIPLERPAWPTERSDLLFLWEGNKKQNFQYDVNSGSFTDARMRLRGTARYGRFGEMSLEGGIILAVDAGEAVYRACSESDQLTVEAVVLPANIYQGWSGKPRSIISCEWGPGLGSVNFRLAQEHDKLVMYLRQRSVENNTTSVERTELCTLTDDVPGHVIVSYSPGELACYLNGRPVLQTDAVTGTFQWNRPPSQNGLNFGGGREWAYDPFWAERGSPPAFPAWRGRLEGVAIYSRAVGPEEAAANFAAYQAIMKARPVAPRIRLRAKLAAKSDTPNAKDIAPYRDALVVYEYDVEKILAGNYDLKKMRVAQWGLIDTKPAPVTRAGIGDVTELVVEPYTDHPQLEAEMMSDTLEENFDLPLYVDVTNGPTGKPSLTAIRITPYEVWLPPSEKIQFKALAFDQYFNRIDAKVTWSTRPGGSINVGTAYGAGHWFHEARRPGKGTVDADGVVTGTPGTITVTAAGVDAPNVKGTAVVGIGDYPGVNPCVGMPLRLGANSGGGAAFKGDIDRIRIYRRVLTPEEIADHAARKGLEVKDAHLVGDWTFDRPKDGAYPNIAGEGLDAKIIGQVEHIQDAPGGYVRLTGKGYLNVASDKRLDISKALTMEAWIRPKEGGCLFARQRVWMWGFCLQARRDWLMLDGLRTSWMAMETPYKFSPDKWTHVVGVLGPGGLWQLWADGKLVKEYKTKPMIISNGN